MSRKTIRLGPLEIGAPRVVGTVTTRESLAALASGAEVPCDIVEARLDQISIDNDWLPLCKKIESRNFPVIVTVRIAEEGGKWSGPDEARLEIFKQGLELSAVDVEFQSKLAAKVAEFARAAGKTSILSFHDFDKTPSLDELSAVASEAAKHGSIVKITTMINSPADVTTLRKLLEKDFGVPLCVMGMGAQGTQTRVEFPSLGSCLTYGYLDKPSAPGQLSAQMLVEQLRQALT